VVLSDVLFDTRLRAVKCIVLSMSTAFELSTNLVFFVDILL